MRARVLVLAAMTLGSLAAQQGPAAAQEGCPIPIFETCWDDYRYEIRKAACFHYSEIAGDGITLPTGHTLAPGCRDDYDS